MKNSSIHRGKIVEEIVRSTKYSLTFIADELKINRGTLYTQFLNPDLKWERIIEIGRVIKHDFSKEFPELTTVVHPDRIESFPAPKEDLCLVMLSKCMEEKEMYMKLYLDMDQKYKDLLLEFRNLKK